MMHCLRNLLAIIAVMLLYAVAAYGQDVPALKPECPQGLVCLSQEAANRVAQEKRELVALREQVAGFPALLIAKDKNVEEIRKDRDAAVAKVTERLHATEVELAGKTGELKGKDAEVTRCQATFEVLLKAARPKKNGLINF